MKYLRNSAIALALPLAAVSTTALAGGLSEPVVAAPPPAPVAVAAPVGRDWTGFYVGGQLGYGDVQSDAVDDDTNGGLLGVHAGYLYDFGSFVVGGELDIDGTNIESESNSIEVESIARAKLRLGYDAGAFMPYATFGAATLSTTNGLEGDDSGGFAGLGVDFQQSNSNIRYGFEVLQHQFDDFDGGGDDIDATTAAVRVSFQF